MILLARNIYNHLVNARPVAVLQSCRRNRSGEIGVWSVVAAELTHGVTKRGSLGNRQTWKRVLAPQAILPVGGPAAWAYGELRPELESKSRTIGERDTLMQSIQSHNRLCWRRLHRWIRQGARRAARPLGVDAEPDQRKPAGGSVAAQRNWSGTAGERRAGSAMAAGRGRKNSAVHWNHRWPLAAGGCLVVILSHHSWASRVRCTLSTLVVSSCTCTCSSCMASLSSFTGAC